MTTYNYITVVAPVPLQTRIENLCQKYALISNGVTRTFAVGPETNDAAAYPDIDLDLCKQAVSKWRTGVVCGWVGIACCPCTLGIPCCVAPILSKQTGTMFQSLVKNNLDWTQVVEGTVALNHNKTRIYFYKLSSNFGKSVYFEEYDVSPRNPPPSVMEEKSKKKSKKSKKEESSSGSDDADEE